MAEASKGAEGLQIMYNDNGEVLSELRQEALYLYSKAVRILFPVSCPPPPGVGRSVGTI